MSTAAPAAPAASPAGSGRPSRTPGVVFVALAVVLVALVAAAFTPAQPPPPPTAEFAPEAAKAIKAPPPNQTSQVGKAGTTGNRGGSQGLKKLLTRGVPVPPGYAERNEQYWRRNLAVCVFGSFTTLVSLSMLLPFLPLYVRQLGVESQAAVIEWSGVAFSATTPSRVRFRPYSLITIWLSRWMSCGSSARSLIRTTRDRER